MAWYIVFLFLFLLAGCTSSNSDQATQDAGGSQTSPQATIADAGDERASPPNGPALCPAGQCNYQTQEGCSALQDGASASCIPKLQPDRSVAPACVESGTRLAGESCSSWSDCVRGYVCAGATCRKLCCGKDWTGCPAGESCTAPFSLSDHTATISSGAYVCAPSHACDPLTGTPCGAASMVCQIVDPIGSTACVAPPAEGVGATPGDLCPPCQNGFTCTGFGCARLCSIAGGSPSCPREEGRCVHWSHDPEGIGECTAVN